MVYDIKKKKDNICIRKCKKKKIFQASLVIGLVPLNIYEKFSGDFFVGFSPHPPVLTESFGKRNS